MLHDREYSKDKTRSQIQTFIITDSSTASVQHKKHTFTFSIPAGEYLLHSKNSEGNFYAAIQPFTGLKILEMVMEAFLYHMLLQKPQSSIGVGFLM